MCGFLAAKFSRGSAPRCQTRCLLPTYLTLRSYVTNFPPRHPSVPVRYHLPTVSSFSSYVPVHLSLIASTLFSPLRVASGQIRSDCFLVRCAGWLWCARYCCGCFVTCLLRCCTPGKATRHSITLPSIHCSQQEQAHFSSCQAQEKSPLRIPPLISLPPPGPALLCPQKVPVPSLGFLSCPPATCCSAQLWTQPPRPHCTAHKHYPGQGQSTGHVSKFHQRLRLAPARNRSLAPYPTTPTTSTHCLCLPTHPRRDLLHRDKPQPCYFPSLSN